MRRPKVDGRIARYQSQRYDCSTVFAEISSAGLAPLELRPLMEGLEVAGVVSLFISIQRRSSYVSSGISEPTMGYAGSSNRR